MCTVVNKHTDGYDVYIGRGSKWGNPFKMTDRSDEERERVIEEYRGYLWHKIKQGVITTEQLRELNGKKLGCFCKPKACHGDVIKNAVQWAEDQYAKEVM